MDLTGDFGESNSTHTFFSYESPRPPSPADIAVVSEQTQKMIQPSGGVQPDCVRVRTRNSEPVVSVKQSENGHFSEFSYQCSSLLAMMDISESQLESMDFGDINRQLSIKKMSVQEGMAIKVMRRRLKNKRAQHLVRRQRAVNRISLQREVGALKEEVLVLRKKITCLEKEIMKWQQLCDMA